MPSIQRFDVLQPPTSGEVEEHLITALRHGGVFENVVLLPQQEVPASEPQAVSFQVRQTIHPKEGGVIIAGDNEKTPSIVLRTSADPETPATATMVTT